MKPIDWLFGTDTGTSSKTIASVMMGADPSCVPGNRMVGIGDIPKDGDDFGRCHRLLCYFPEWRERLSEVAKVHPKWGPMVEAWPQLTGMYLQCSDTDGRYTYRKNKEAADALYKRMKEIENACLVADGWVQTSPGSWRRDKSSIVEFGEDIAIQINRGE